MLGDFVIFEEVTSSGLSSSLEKLNLSFPSKGSSGSPSGFVLVSSSSSLDTIAVFVRQCFSMSVESACKSCSISPGTLWVLVTRGSSSSLSSSSEERTTLFLYVICVSVPAVCLISQIGTIASGSSVRSAPISTSTSSGFGLQCFLPPAPITTDREFSLASARPSTSISMSDSSTLPISAFSPPRPSADGGRQGLPSCLFLLGGVA
mmetsp:Transcript_2675/g.4454  ORF Transcript_2675/g.4454 Transcript_2675/m.4454 type:complete len:206 (-) Transcript_2675:185-802(-)